MENMKANGMKDSNTAKESLNTKRETHTKDNGHSISSMVKAPIYKSYSLMIKKNSINTSDSLKMGSIMGRELWSTQMEISMMESGLMVRKRDQACMNGPMVTIMMEIGEKTLHKAQGLHVLVVSFTTESFILVLSTVWGRRLMRMVTL